MRVLIAIPVYNEENYVLSVLNEVARYTEPVCETAEPVDVVVIDDGSTDATPTLLARKPVDVIRHKTNLGYGRSIRDAFLWAMTYDYDWLITMDCDEQHEPASLPDFYAACKRVSGCEKNPGTNEADILSGSRYLDIKMCGDPPPADRRKINEQITETLNDRLGFNLTDAFCGFKAYRVSKLKHLDLNVDGYAMPIQLWVQAAAHQMKVMEVPIKLIYNDPNRSFGGPLDNPEQRIQYYEGVLDEELTKHAHLFPDHAGAKVPV